MNWYKLAFPIVDNKDPYSYTSLFHRGKRPLDQELGIWIILKDRTLHRDSIENNPDGHFGWEHYSGINMLAQGRYALKEDGDYEVTVVIRKFQLSESQIDYRRKTVEKILDKEFNNPRILEFK